MSEELKNRNEEQSRRKMTRREAMGGLLATGAVAATRYVLGPDAPDERGVPKDESMQPERQGQGPQLTEMESKHVNSVLDHALDKNDKYVHALFEVQNGALKENYRMFVIKHLTRRIRISDEQILQERQRLLSDSGFKTALLKAYIELGFPKYDGSISAYFLLEALKFDKKTAYSHPDALKDVQWSDLSDDELRSHMSRITIGVRYNAGSDRRISFGGPGFGVK
ncbi:MAG: hypothetical protein U1D26_01810 [Patescibacteria group bacterium]|nr:hypothetical protein [bacterium]MDZ4227192.1 hypothetical protein [Patescibacteria group bacterium]